MQCYFMLQEVFCLYKCFESSIFVLLFTAHTSKGFIKNKLHREQSLLYLFLVYLTTTLKDSIIQDVSKHNGKTSEMDSSYREAKKRV
jgi:hypothetical protein